MGETREDSETRLVSIYGKAATERGDIGPKTARLAKKLGKALAESKKIKMIATGGASGYPHIVAKAFRSENPEKEVVAFPPTDKPEGFEKSKLVRKEEWEKEFTVMALPTEVPKDELKALISRVQDFLRFTKDNNGVAIVIGGGRGTKHEIIGSLNMGIPVFILEGSGGFADQVRTSSEIPENKRDLIHYANTPKNLVKQITSQV